MNDPVPDRTIDHVADDPTRTTDLPARDAADTGRRADTSVAARAADGPTATYHPPDAGAYRTGAYADSGDPAPAPQPAGAPVVPGFQILGELGRGGMGVVYKAHHFTLDRVVALKMILAGANASPGQIERFFVEARAVAKFQRPDIVQIFEVGEVGGLPYCALEFVAGGALSAKLAREPQLPRYAAEMTVQLARAMAYAHKQGLIHRDLKPANILVGADGQLKVTDFGLAKELAADSGQTQSGQVVGTPSYMSPEQAEGRADVGVPTDVYALGAVLYDMLTGRPPFAGTSVHETLELVRTREPVAPSELAGRVPRDLETICLKCLQKDISRRYASAGALADDLQRFLDGKPILARPVSVVEKAWRWAKRNPVGAAALLLAAVVLVGGPLVAVRMSVLKGQADENAKNEAIAKIQAQNERDDKETARAGEEAAKDLARENERKATFAWQEGRKVVDASALAARGMLTVIDDRLRGRAKFAAIRREIIDIAAENLDKLRGTLGAHPLEDRNDALAYARMGEVLLAGQKIQAAGEMFDRAADVLAAATRTNPTDGPLLRNLAAVTNRRGDIALRLGDVAKAHAIYSEALKTRQEWAAMNKDQAERLRAVAQSHALIGRANLMRGEPAAADASYAAAIAQFDDLPGKTSSLLVVRRERLEALDLRGDARFKLGDEDGAEKCYRDALQKREELQTITPKPEWAVTALKTDTALSHLVIGDFLLTGRKDADGAKAEYHLALNSFAALFKADDDSIEVGRGLAAAHYRLGTVGGPLTGAAHFAVCLRLRAELAKIDPKDTQAKIEWMLALGRCGQAVTAEGKAKELLAQSGKDQRILFHTACGLAVAAGGATDPAVATRCRDKAVQAITDLVASGWKDRVALETDPDLDAVRGDPAFAAALAGVPAPPKKP